MKIYILVRAHILYVCYYMTKDFYLALLESPSVCVRMVLLVHFVR